MKRFFHFATAALLATSLTATHAGPPPDPEHLPWKTASQALEKVTRFVETKMTTPNGAIRVNAVLNRPISSAEARNGECLSETVGQRMELALLENDRKAFERQFHLAIRNFAGPNGLLAWKVSPNLSRKADTSATIDDWRVAWACQLAYERWKDSATFDFGLKIATSLTHSVLPTGLVPEALSLQDGCGEPSRLPLCYLHLPGVRAWSPHLTTLNEVQKKSLLLLKGGQRKGGTLAEAWNPSSTGYTEGKSDEVLTLIALQYLQSVEPQSPLLLEALKRRAGMLRLPTPLPQAFDTVSGLGEQEAAGAAVYALLARLMIRFGDMKSAAIALNRMLEFQNPESHRFAGAIGEEPVYSFDQLEAMLALREYLNAQK